MKAVVVIMLSSCIKWARDATDLENLRHTFSMAPFRPQISAALFRQLDYSSWGIAAIRHGTGSQGWRGFADYILSKMDGPIDTTPYNPSCKAHDAGAVGFERGSKNEVATDMDSRVPSPWDSKDIKGTHKSSVDLSETAKFAAVADTWWDYEGPYKPLHAMNPVRLSFIRAALCRHFRKDPMIARPLEGLRILDVGCGGGIACEPLARMGGRVTGIDAVEKNVRVAAVHAERDPATSSIEYRYTTAEQLLQETKTFDVVVALEVIEHVADPKEFCKSLASLAKDDGIVVISTINRSITAYGLAIVAAENVLGWVPRGTHNWFKFVTPEELSLVMNESSLLMEEMAGMAYNPITRNWSLSDDTNINYIVYGIKNNDNLRIPKMIREDLENPG